MKTEQNGLALIKQEEGFESEPYLCPAGVPTIGFGSTYYTDGRKVQLDDDAITEEEAERLLKYNVDKVYAKFVNAQLRVPITQNQFDALVSFTYNVGIGNFRSSTLLKKLNKEDYEGAANEFARWKYANGKVLNGLIRRRKNEKALFEKVFE